MVHRQQPTTPAGSSIGRRKFLKTAVAATAAGVSARRACWATANETILQIASEPQMFLDDWIISQRDGFERVLHRPDKQGLIKNTDGTDWDLGSVYLGNIVCRDAQGHFHMTYRYAWWDPSVRALHPSIGKDKAHWFRESTAYATSEDGIHWRKPRLGLADGPTGFRPVADFPFKIPAGLSRDNNLGCPIDFAYDLHTNGNVTDPDKRFLLRVVKMSDTHPFAKPLEAQLYYARDWPDFVNDRRWRENLSPIARGRLSPRGFKQLAGYDHKAAEWFSVSQDRISNWIKRGGRDIARFSTRDLVNWRGPELVLPVPADESRDAHDWVEYMDLGASRIGGPLSGAWLGQLVIFHSDRSDRQFMMPTIKNVWRKGTTELRLIISRDAGRSWQPVGGRTPWLPCHAAPHGYDRLVFACCPLRVGSEAWFYYTGWDGDHLVFQPDGSLFEPGYLRTPRTARATLRWDGYVSLDARNRPGRLITRPFKFRGDRLLINLNAPNGKLIAELLDASGQPLNGFTALDVVETRGDGLEIPVNWRGRSSLKSLEGAAIRLRLELREGALYGFRFGA